jgi:hypothetical protein
VPSSGKAARTRPGTSLSERSIVRYRWTSRLVITGHGPIQFTETTGRDNYAMFCHYFHIEENHCSQDRSELDGRLTLTDLNEA